jgi:hypothetical protein
MAALSRSDLKQLICGILTQIRHHGGFATKTKLIKLLYLIDVESVRDVGETLTSLDWIFHLYGPWTTEYDALLLEMEQEGLVQLRSGHDERDATFVNPVQVVGLEKVPLPVTTYLAARHVIERWAVEPTRKLLDYVYFDTEPMENPIRGERLDFRSVKPRNQIPLYRPVRSSASEKEIRQVRRKFQELSSKAPRPKFTEPRYDSAFQEAVNFINLENE